MRRRVGAFSYLIDGLLDSKKFYTIPFMTAVFLSEVSFHPKYGRYGVDE